MISLKNVELESLLGERRPVASARRSDRLERFPCRP